MVHCGLLPEEMMTGAEIKALREALDLAQVQLAQLIDVQQLTL